MSGRNRLAGSAGTPAEPAAKGVQTSGQTLGGVTVEQYVAAAIGEPHSRHEALERQAIGRIVRKEHAFLSRSLEKDDATRRRKLVEFFAEHSAYIARELAVSPGTAALCVNHLLTCISAWCDADPEHFLEEVAKDRALILARAVMPAPAPGRERTIASRELRNVNLNVPGLADAVGELRRAVDALAKPRRLILDDHGNPIGSEAGDPRRQVVKATRVAAKKE